MVYKTQNVTLNADTDFKPLPQMAISKEDIEKNKWNFHSGAISMSTG